MKLHFYMQTNYNMAATVVRFHAWDKHLSSKKTDYIIYQNATAETLEPED